MPKALVIGHKGQDGFYLSQLLQEKGYSVTGVGRPSGNSDSFDVTRFTDMCRLLTETKPDEIYYLAAFHHSSEDAPIDTQELESTSLAVNTSGVHNVLEAILALNLKSRLFYAGSSRMFGDCVASPQNEATPFSPMCIYGKSKVGGASLCSSYRNEARTFAVTGILYNHESPLRPPRFISRKIVRAAVQIARGSKQTLTVGSLDAQVDWGYAPDYVRAMWQMLQLDQPVDFVIGTGTLHSVREFVDIAFSECGLHWHSHVIENPDSLPRTVPRGTLRADSTKLREACGWRPEVDFRQMIKIMIEAEANCL